MHLNLVKSIPTNQMVFGMTWKRTYSIEVEKREEERNHKGGRVKSVFAEDNPFRLGKEGKVHQGEKSETSSKNSRDDQMVTWLLPRYFSSRCSPVGSTNKTCIQSRCPLLGDLEEVSPCHLSRLTSLKKLAMSGGWEKQTTRMKGLHCSPLTVTQ